MADASKSRDASAPDIFDFDRQRYITDHKTVCYADTYQLEAIAQIMERPIEVYSAHNTLRFGLEWYGAGSTPIRLYHNGRRDNSSHYDALVPANDAPQSAPATSSPSGARASPLAGSASLQAPSTGRKRNKGKQRTPEGKPTLPEDKSSSPPPPQSIERVIAEFSSSPAIFASVSTWAKSLGAAFTVYGQLRDDALALKRTLLDAILLRPTLLTIKNKKPRTRSSEDFDLPVAPRGGFINDAGFNGHDALDGLPRLAFDSVVRAVKEILDGNVGRANRALQSNGLLEVAGDVEAKIIKKYPRVIEGEALRNEAESESTSYTSARADAKN
jgi:hypothetical protein